MAILAEKHIFEGPTDGSNDVYVVLRHFYFFLIFWQPKRLDFVYLLTISIEPYCLPMGAYMGFLMLRKK